MADTGPGSDGGPGIGDAQTAAADPGSAASDGGSDAPCEHPPKLFPETAAGVYGPFSKVDGGSNLTCQPGQRCCEAPASAGAPSTCQPSGAACPVAGPAPPARAIVPRVRCRPLPPRCVS